MVPFLFMAGPAAAAIYFGFAYDYWLLWLVFSIGLALWTAATFFPTVMSTDSSGSSKEADREIELTGIGWMLLGLSAIFCLVMTPISGIW